MRSPMLLLLVATSCATPAPTQGASVLEETSDVAGLDAAYRTSLGFGARITPEASPTTLGARPGSPRLRRLARQVSRMSRLVGRSRAIALRDRDAASSCGALAEMIASGADYLPTRHLLVAGAGCAASLAAVGNRPGPTRAFVVQSELLARELLSALETSSAVGQATR